MPYTHRLRTVSTVSEAPSPEWSASDPTAAVAVVRGLLATLDADREHFGLLALNAKNRIIGFKICHTGGKSIATVDRALVLRDALLLSASSFIVFHNHPSGSAEPSPEDLLTTRALQLAGDAIGITLADSLIIGAPGVHVSLHQRGKL